MNLSTLTIILIILTLALIFVAVVVMFFNIKLALIILTTASVGAFLGMTVAAINVLRDKPNKKL